MPTGDKYFNATTKRTISYDDMKNNIIAYLRDTDTGILKSFYAYPIVLGDTKVGLEADGTDKFKLSSVAVASDGEGRRLETDVGTMHADYFEGVDFGNVSANTYDVALHYAEIPDGIKINGRTGQPEFDTWQEVIGLSGQPNGTIIEAGSTLTFTCDNILESGEDNSGRQVMVWKNLPGIDAITTTLAYEICTVNASNQITTVSNFGQSDPSTTLADYTLVALGPCVYASTDLTSAAGYVYLGTITGNGPAATPTAFDTGAQKISYSNFDALPYITRYEVLSDEYKVSVSATAADETENQVEVNDKFGTAQFTVDGFGTVSAVSVVATGGSIPGVIQAYSTDTTVTSGAIYGESQSATVGVGVKAYAGGTAGRAIYASCDSASGSTYGVYSQVDSTDGRGVYGYCSATSGVNYAISGKTLSGNGYGVYGENDGTSGFASAVYGKSASIDARAIYAYAEHSSGSTYGLYAEANSTAGTGAYGKGFTGVFGASIATSGIGVRGNTTAATSSGVKGDTSNSTSDGVLGHNTSAAGVGVRGLVTGTGKAVYGHANGTGRGVHAYNEASSGTGYGIYSEVESTDAIAGYFENKSTSGNNSTALYVKNNYSGGIAAEIVAASTGSDIGTALKVSNLGDTSSNIAYSIHAIGNAIETVIYSETSNTDTGSKAIYGESTASTGAVYGVYGETSSSTNTSAGVYGVADDGYGVRGSSSAGYGMYATGFQSTLHAGLKVDPGALEGHITFGLGQTSDPTTPVEGALYYNSSGQIFRYYNGTTWLTLATV